MVLTCFLKTHTLGRSLTDLGRGWRGFDWQVFFCSPGGQTEDSTAHFLQFLSNRKPFIEIIVKKDDYTISVRIIDR